MARAPSAASRIARGDAIALTKALTRIDSRNPSIDPDGPGEAEAARFLASVLASWGFAVALQDVADGRQNVVAHLGRPEAPALLFAGHLDTVGIDGMTHSPFDAEERDGRIYGRGSADMKSGIAAMCAAAVLAADSVPDPSRRQVVIAAVVDEEYDSIGMRAFAETASNTSACVLTEPTRLAICPAHRGFVWIELTFTGRAVHGSRYDIGVDAIRHAGLFLKELEDLDSTELPRKTHSLLGRGSVHASLIEGGTGLSTYPERCVLTIERRTLPGESQSDIESEVRALCDRARERAPNLDVSVRLITAQSPSDVSTEAPIVRSLSDAIQAEGTELSIEGMSAWTDAAILNDVGIPSVCFGPGDIRHAHAPEEFVPISEIDTATRVLTRVARDWLEGRE
jgi:acetylornithine deacetylase